MQGTLWLLEVGTTDCCQEQMTLVRVFSISPKGMQTGPDHMCARVQVKRFDINHLSKISLLHSGKHFMRICYFEGRMRHFYRRN